ncbi:protein MODIFYING WALL LIGNIN-1-like isoform X2 [Primulina tabacum]|uniref:protein MODIFYING WALL LIGNIN-1-like isoform X2 n=1 Tax=Primulina tabacum TaxID=48773 RepID=UPI003F5A248F
MKDYFLHQKVIVSTNPNPRKFSVSIHSLILIQKEDLRLEGKLCYLPRSAGVELGVMGLIFLVATQVTANLLLISRKFCSAEDITSCKLRMPILSCALLILSWISFGIAVVLISAATSMSRSQQLGQGWLDGKCYLVKDGVYLGSAMLVLMALGSTLSSAAIVVRHRQAEENRKVHAGVQE